MQHTQFAEWAAERLETVAAAVEDKERGGGHSERISSARANEMRVAAFMVRDMAQALTRAENPSPEVLDRENQTRSGTNQATEAVESEKQVVLS